MYFVKIEYFFYQNTLNVNSNSHVRLSSFVQDEYGDLKLFKTKNDAVLYLGKTKTRLTRCSFMDIGPYILRHGEYSRPEYVIKKIRNKTSKQPIIIKVKDIHNKSKIHCYKFYLCGHVYYNQQYGERLHYSSWTRLYLSNYPSNGYHKYYLQAKAKYNKMKQA